MKTTLSLESFFKRELGLTPAEESLEMRKSEMPEHFILSVEVNKERLVEILNKYFGEVVGTYEFLRPESEYTLDFSYNIPEEQGICTITNFIANNEIWATITASG